MKISLFLYVLPSSVLKLKAGLEEVFHREIDKIEDVGILGINFFRKSYMKERKAIKKRREELKKLQRRKYLEADRAN